MPVNALALDTAADLLLEAALGTLSWPQALHSIAAASDAMGANTMPIRSQIPAAIRYTDNLEGLTDYYFQHEAYRWCIRQKGLPLLESKGIMVDQDCSTVEERKNSLFYQEFLARFGIHWSAYIGFEVGADLWSCLLHRSPAAEPFSQPEQELLIRLRHPMKAAASLAYKIGLNHITGMKEAFELGGVAALFFNRAGKICHVTTKAGKLLHSGITISNGELCSNRAGDNGTLRRHIYSMINSGLIGDLAASKPVTLQRDVGRPLIVQVQRVRGNVQDLFPAVSAIGLLTDPQVSVQPQEQILQSVYGLTHAECRLAISLAAGEDLTAIADNFNVSYHTVRAQLKSIFTKLGVSRQGELVSLLLRLN
jgi:DNA-binding CsgD family transcriptional regulator